MSSENKAILAVPAFSKGKGGGHLARCIKLVRDLRAINRDAWLYLPLQSQESDDLFRLTNFDITWRVTDDDLCLKKWEFIVLDNFRTSFEELDKWKKTAPVIGIDEGGPCRDCFDFLIDILPNIERVKPNIADVSLLPLPLRELFKKFHTENTEGTENTEKNLKILISFGFEDSVGLGNKTAEILKRKNIEYTLVNESNRIENLAEHLCEYDLLITHYGITAFEALYAGVPVLLINPTPYHEKLSKAAGFFTSSITFVPLCLCERSFIDKLTSQCKVLAAKFGLDKEGKSLAELINGFSPQVNRLCPVCGSPAPAKSIARFSDRTYRRCKKCGVIYMDRINQAPITYKKEYFFEDYQKQYGKTYLEDFPNLIAQSKHRLEIIKNLARRYPLAATRLPLHTTHSLLDIGCAYGAFLTAASEEGFTPYGIDPAEDAVKYVQEKLGIPASHGFFPNSSFLTSHSSFNIITLWFVIEHFRESASALAEIHRLLEPGGILAFSTPSFTGISARKNLHKFLQNSPADHYTIWSPKMCKKTLFLAGFKVRKIRNCSFHPERFPLLGRFSKNKKSPAYWVLKAVNSIFMLGDTYEAYAVK